MIQFKGIAFNSFQVNTYFVWDESGECLIIDPAFSTEEEQVIAIEFISQNKLKPVAQINTHCHVDHVAGVNFIREKYSLPFSAHREESRLADNAPVMGRIFGFRISPLNGIDRFIEEHEQIRFGSSALEALHVPGHSPGSLAYYCADGGFVLTGDALFQGSIGRTDLPGGDYETLISSIREKLFTLPGNTVVCPGHGAFSSIADELASNPFFR